jgi:ABC-2 type transport system ATP-binding protein
MARTVFEKTAIEAVSLVKTYSKGIRALDGLDLSVEAGTVFGLLGPNGAGKSTTVRILCTLSTPDSGSASVAGHDVLRSPEAVRRAIGCVSQQSGVDVTATGRENLLLQGHLHGMGGRSLRQRTQELLASLGLTDAADRLAKTYSGGMQRRLDIAMGLIHEPRVLFLDEPTTGLDPEVRAAMWDQIARLSRDEGLTILLTTHYLEEADRLAQQLAIVDGGRVVASGTPEELKGELRGDTIQVELREPAERVLLALPGVSELAVDGRVLRARADHGASRLPSLLAALEAEGLGVASATVARPSLDDVYLRHAGRAFEAAA